MKEIGIMCSSAGAVRVVMFTAFIHLLFVCVFYSVNQIKYNTIFFYIIYKRERLKRYWKKQKMLINSYLKLKSNKSENLYKININK